MNKRSFMRTIDENKILQVEKAAISLIVANGYGGASVASIAEQAGVSKGYLYRFYDSKQSLVKDLLSKHINSITNKIQEEINNREKISDVIKYVVYNVFKIANTEPNHIKFIHVLLHNYNFQLEQKERKKIKELCTRIYNIGVNNSEIDVNTTEEEIFNICIIYPIEFINLRFKNFFGHNSWNQQDINRVTSFCVNALKI